MCDPRTADEPGIGLPAEAIGETRLVILPGAREERQLLCI
jgi:hypothetical protein